MGTKKQSGGVMMRGSLMRRLAFTSWPILLTLLAGCHSLPVYHDNPTTVACNHFDHVWTGTVGVIEKYFDIAYENRYDGRIETEPQAGATLLEPWRSDSVGGYERLESTLQTIRRRAFVLVQPAPSGGFTITVEVYKELEDLYRPAFSTFASGTFISSLEPIREQVVTSDVQAPAGWISVGRDTKLEARIIDDLHHLIDGPIATPF
jgi:hypothetical protein